jgi:hypothetical protein
MIAVRKMLALAAGVGFAMTLGACGGSSGDGCSKNPTAPGCSPPPTTVAVQPCTQNVVESGGGSHPARTLVFNDFSVPDAGRLDTIVDWTFASTRMGVFLVPVNTCTLEQFNARSCNFLVRSEPSTVKPRKISTPNFAAGNYRWLIGNFSDVEESVSYQFVLSKGSCAALTGSELAGFSLGNGAPSIERLIRF